MDGIFAVPIDLPVASCVSTRNLNPYAANIYKHLTFLPCGQTNKGQGLSQDKISRKQDQLVNLPST